MNSSIRFLLAALALAALMAALSPAKAGCPGPRCVTVARPRPVCQPAVGGRVCRPVMRPVCQPAIVSPVCGRPGNGGAVALLPAGTVGGGGQWQAMNQSLRSHGLALQRGPGGSVAVVQLPAPGNRRP